MWNSRGVLAEEIGIMDALQKAMEWAKNKCPDSSLQHKAAFANSVSYLVTGASGGFGGPSIREHLCSWSLGETTTVSIAGEAMTAIIPGSLPMPGSWQFDAAIEHCKPLCFDPAEKYRNKLLQILEREHCFDDDPTDLEALRGKFA